MAKIDVLIVTEYSDDTIQGNTLFPIFDKAKQAEVVAQAEKAFEAKAKENGMSNDPEELSNSLDEGLYESGGYQVFLAWADMELPA